MHLLFQCETAKQMWMALGLITVIKEAVTIDRSGSGVLEHLMHERNNNLPGVDGIGQKETIAVACWYLWWILRRRTHAETVPPISQCMMSVLTITSNAPKSMSKTAGPKSHWERPSTRYVKVNVDAHFIVIHVQDLLER
jgi:hypothetical protein